MEDFRIDAGHRQLAAMTRQQTVAAVHGTSAFRPDLPRRSPEYTPATCDAIRERFIDEPPAPS